MFKGSVTEISGKVVSIVVNKSLGELFLPFHACSHVDCLYC